MNATYKQFAKYRTALQKQTLGREEREEWRERFAGDVVAVANESSDKDTFLKHLHDALSKRGFEVKKLGSGAMRAVFSLPFSLVLKVEVTPETFTFRPFQSGMEARPNFSSNRAELERSKALQAFVPHVYAECYRAFQRPDETINLLVSERLIPIHKFFDEITEALASTDSANLGICPETGRLMVMDVGSEWAEGAEEAFLAGTHPLQEIPFMRNLRW